MSFDAATDKTAGFLFLLSKVVMSDLVSGTVKWFNGEKGYGFIAQESGPDVFAHYSEIQGNGFRSLKEGDKVEFTITDGKKGKQASEIRVLRD